MVVRRQTAKHLHRGKSTRTQDFQLVLQSEGRVEVNKDVLRHPVPGPAAGALGKGQRLHLRGGGDVVALQKDAAGPQPAVYLGKKGGLWAALT